MLKNFEIGRKKALNIIYLKTFYLIVQVKIMLMKCLSGKIKNFKHIIPFLMTLLFLASPNIFWAQEPQWPWRFVGENFQITKNSGDHFLPFVVSNNNIYLAMWYKNTPFGFDIYGARITKEGAVLDKDEIPICTAANDQMFPSAAWDGENFLVVWQDKRSGKRWDIYGARVGIDGTVLDPDGIPIVVGRYDQVSPTLSFDGENYLVVWQGKRTPKIWNVYFTRVSRNGEVIDNPVPVCPSLKNQASPAVAFDGQNYFIVWQDKREGKFWDIYGAKVASSGEILDNNGIAISSTFEDNSSRGDKWRPVLSWNGKYYLIVWMVSPMDNKWFLYGQQVSPEGQPLGGVTDLPIQRDGTNKVFPAIIWNGTEHFLVWEEEPEGDPKIFGASIIPDYRLDISEIMGISTSQVTNAAMPALSMAEDITLVVWQAKSPEGYWQIYGQCIKKQLEIPSDSMDLKE